MSDTHVAKTDAKSADTERSERAEPGVMLPPVDVVEDALGIMLYADLPGVPKDKLHVRIDADALTIEGEVSLPMAGNLEPSHVEVQLPRYLRTLPATIAALRTSSSRRYQERVETSSA